MRKYDKLSFAVVYDAGHFLPIDQPALALEMVQRAVANMDLPTGHEQYGRSFCTGLAVVSSGCGSNTTTTVDVISPDQTLGRDMDVQWRRWGENDASPRAINTLHVTGGQQSIRMGGEW